MDPQQELFTVLLLKLKDKYQDTGIGVYDTFLPPDKTPYPFVYLADSIQDDQANKTTVFGAVSQIIHVWHNNPKQRGTLSKILLEIKDMCYKIGETKNFGWNLVRVNQRVLSDTTTKEPLMHGVLELEFTFN